MRIGDHAAFLLWDGAERVALGRGAVTGVHDGMVSLIANGSAVARVRGIHRRLGATEETTGRTRGAPSMITDTASEYARTRPPVPSLTPPK